MLRAANKTIIISIGIIALVYAATAILASGYIGRRNPHLASLFRPPLFNFSQTYEAGKVLEFSVGMSRYSALETAATDGYTIDTACWGDNRAGGAALYSGSQLSKMANEMSSVCFERDDYSVIVAFNDNVVKTIALTFVRNEII